MELIVAKSAGFCFGVKNAMDKALKTAEEEKNVKTLGPIIHNPDAVNLLEKKGIFVVESIDDVKPEDTVIIRSHGIGKKELLDLKEKGVNVIDATCPYVKNIHNIVEQNYSKGYKIVIIGDSEHPEVKGINGWCDNSAIIIKDVDEVNEEKFKNQKVCVVAQTTFNLKKWHLIASKIIFYAKESLVINTICSATEIRQKETEEIAKNVDLMIVIGGKNSSNTKKLYDISKDNCENVIFIENADELEVEKVKDYEKIGITAGASTPQFVIEKVIEKLSNIIDLDEEVSNEDIDYFSDFKRLEVGDIIKGKVIHVTENEVYFDIGYKSDGILLKEEVDSFVNLKEQFKLGEVYDVEVIKLNDGEGNVLLSRKNIERMEFIEKLKQCKLDGTLIEVEIVKSIRGGFECRIGDIKCFMPLSHSGLSFQDSLESIVGKKFKVNILEVKEDENVEIIVSRKDVAKQEKLEKARKKIESLKEGDVQKGKIKTIIDSGVFVDANDYDVFIPISELSWKKIQKPSDVVNIGDNVEFMIIKIDRAMVKVTGSIKRTMETPWEKFTKKYSVGDIIEGKIVGFADFGAFVELEDGVQGLVHISNMSYIKINRPQDIARIGQKVKVKIIDIDYENKKISLSMKDAKSKVTG